MKQGKHTETEVLKSLQRKHDVKIDSIKGTITVNRSESRKNDLGNKSHGKIDFLKKQLNYTLIINK